jgi:hypothetical protein
MAAPTTSKVVVVALLQQSANHVSHNLPLLNTITIKVFHIFHYDKCPMNFGNRFSIVTV